MKQFRMMIKVVAVALVTVGLYLFWLMGWLVVFFFPDAQHRWRNWIFRCWAKGVAAVTRLRITVEGKPPQAPFFLVANHLSYADIIALAAHLDCVFVAKSDVRDWFLIGFLCRSMEIIFVDRSKRHDLPRVIRLIEQAWRKKQGVIVFPEGTSSKGDQILPFKPSLLEPAVKAGLPVSYATLSYETPADEPPAYLSVCWWGDMEFAPHVKEFLKLREVSARIRFGSETFLEADRKVLAQKLRDAIEEQFSPLVVEAEDDFRTASKTA